jgi:hypothetical protein
VLDTETLWTAPGHLTARWRSVFIQIRSAPMTLEALSSIEMAARLTRAQMPRGDCYGAMFVIQPGAPVVTGQTAVRQRQLLETLGDDERLHVAVVFEGDAVGAIAHRVLARALLRTRRRKVCRSLPEGARGLVSVLGLPDASAGELVEFVESMRARL